MDQTFRIDLIRNVQPTERKMSVSKEFVGPKRQEEKSHRQSHEDSGENKKREKPMKLYGREISAADDINEEGNTIDITV